MFTTPQEAEQAFYQALRQADPALMMRVWADDEDSSTWHPGYGGGLWVGVLNQFVFNVQTAFSDEDRLVTFGLDWFY